MTVVTEEQLIEWTQKRADFLHAIASNSSPGPHPIITSSLGTEMMKAAQFLHDQAPGSIFVGMADASLKNGPSTPSIEAMGDALDGWADMMKDGLARSQPFEVRARVEASTDLLEQVDVLLDDSGVHPAAAVMLAGAALEEFLRSLHHKCSVQISGDPTISKLTGALQQGGLIDKGDVKELTALGDVRNSAAHGQFDRVSYDDARLFRERVNLFINKKRI